MQVLFFQHSCGDDSRCSDSWPLTWHAEHQVEQSCCCTLTCPSPSRTSPYTVSVERKMNVKHRHMKLAQNYSGISVRRYPADKLVDPLAVDSVASLSQGSEGAGLHVLLAGLLVFALQAKK